MLESENALAWAADRIEKDRKTIARYQRKSILCFMMAVSCFARTDPSGGDERPTKVAAPMYFEFGWQIYNSVFVMMIHADSSVNLLWRWLLLPTIRTRSAVEIKDYMFVIGQKSHCCKSSPSLPNASIQLSLGVIRIGGKLPWFEMLIFKMFVHARKMQQQATLFADCKGFCIHR